MTETQETEKELQIMDTLCSELPHITEPDQAYVLNILKGMSQHDAYALSRDVSHMTNGSVHATASALRRQPHIQAWLDHYKLTMAHSYSMDLHMEELEEARQLSRATGNMGAMVQATIHKGKASQLYKETVELVDSAGVAGLLLELSNALGHDVAKRVTIDAEKAGVKKSTTYTIDSIDQLDGE